MHADTDSGPVDLVLPAGLPVASLLPDIVELVAAGSDDIRGRWQLATVCGTVLDESIALREQGIGDGDLLLLSPAQPRVPTFARADLVTAVLTTAPTPGDTRALRVTAGLVAASAGIAASVAGRGGATASLLSAAALLCVVAGATVVTSRTGRGSCVCDPLACLTVLTAALCGALVVPGPLHAAHALLATAVAAAVGLALLRIGVGAPTASTAFACGGLLGAAALSGAVLWDLPAHTVGVTAALLGLGALSLAPRLSVVMSGLAPAPSLADEPHPDADRRARAGHRALVGLVIGASATVGVGAAVVAVGSLRGPGHWLPDAAFCAVVGSALVLRARCYAAGRCRWALVASGTCSLTAGFVVLVAHYGHWAAALAVCAGVAVIAREAPEERSPVASRALEVVEYAVLAAVVPVGCAALDVFNLARTASLM
ncbi:hypothetical protein NIIDNTM18_11930 [Mycolicibacterium litorale]|uniref:EccD-like transmembrane domain-containing protein n=1 Tax=Mycolicibacterium litorale TaxID=758802 RepID=A0A6S6P0K8_9MYCO|nr:hypothetical protein NIIDNTM18_11930 [Mycolicibacterium litorale]